MRTKARPGTGGRELHLKTELEWAKEVMKDLHPPAKPTQCA